jgi:hypothetical protein
MVIELSEQYTHGPCKVNGKKYSDDELKSVILKWMNKQGIDASNVKFNEDGTVQVNEGPSLKLHSLILQAEEMGLGMKFTKKTYIELS